MSILLSDRLLSTFINVRQRLTCLLSICQIHEKPMWTGEDDCGEECRFFGPYQSDIEELEKSINQISSLIENFQHEKIDDEAYKSILDYPLCENGWTLNQIDQIEDEHPLDLNILSLLNRATLNKSDEKQFSSVEILNLVN